MSSYDQHFLTPDPDDGIVLSICIATLNRGAYIGVTLDTIVDQLQPGVELVVVDGASTDCTHNVVTQYTETYNNVRYFLLPENGGVDADFDKAVAFARGKYCWLMTDDDLLMKGAIEAVLSAIDTDPDMIVVNSELHSADFEIQFSRRLMDIDQNIHFCSDDRNQMFGLIANYISYIGAVVILKDYWSARERLPYYGSLFIHVGVAFQNPTIENVYLIAEPKILIRYGNAMWTPKRFNIWMFMWPELIWSFGSFSDQVKSSVVALEPWKSLKKMIIYKAIGGYGKDEYSQFIKPRTSGIQRCAYWGLAMLPTALISFLAILVCAAVGGRRSTELYDIYLNSQSGRFGRWLARKLLYGAP